MRMFTRNLSRSVVTAVGSALASATVGTTAAIAITRELHAAGAVTHYLALAGRSYAFSVPLGICFNIVWFTSVVGARQFAVMDMKRFAAAMTLVFWLLAGCVTALFAKALPLSLAEWAETRLICGMISALGASELCPKAADLLGLLDESASK